MSGGFDLLVAQVEGAIAGASSNETRALAAIAEVEHRLLAHLKECAEAAVNSGSHFNQGVVRGLEIAAAQVEHGHYHMRSGSIIPFYRKEAGQ